MVTVLTYDRHVNAPVGHAIEEQEEEEEEEEEDEQAQEQED